MHRPSLPIDDAIMPHPMESHPTRFCARSIGGVPHGAGTAREARRTLDQPRAAKSVSTDDAMAVMLWKTSRRSI